MKCPYCNTAFFPEFSDISIGQHKEIDVKHRLYHQYCPQCSELIVGIYETAKSDYGLLPKGKELEDRLKILSIRHSSGIRLNPFLDQTTLQNG